jgi:hypothetical protein
MFFRRKFPKLPLPVVQAELPMPAPRNGAVVLYPGQIARLSPALAKLMSGDVDARTVALTLDTLHNSAITPPDPWPQTLHRFDSLVCIPTGSGVTPAFVFYPL